MNAFLLAAGLGERLRPITLHQAKPTVPFLNVPMAGFGLLLLERAGASDLVVNTHYLAETVESCFRTMVQSPMRLSFSYETHELLGSAGGLGLAKQRFFEAGPALYFNGDTICLSRNPNPLLDLWNDHLQAEPLATLWLTRHPGGNVGRVFVDADGLVRLFSKEQEPVEGLTPYHFVGAIAASKRLVDLCEAKPSNIFYEILQNEINLGARVRAYVDEDLVWLETGTTSDYLAATGVCLAEIQDESPYAEQIKATLDRFSPGWSLMERGVGRALLAAGVELDPSVTVEGFAVIGHGCRVGRGATLRRSVLLPGAHIPEGIEAQDQVVTAPNFR